MEFTYRRLGDGGVVFCGRTWQTHLLTPAAAVIFETLVEDAAQIPVSLKQAENQLTVDLGLDVSTPEIRLVLGMLQDMGLVRP